MKCIQAMLMVTMYWTSGMGAHAQESSTAYFGDEAVEVSEEQADQIRDVEDEFTTELKPLEQQVEELTEKLVVKRKEFENKRLSLLTPHSFNLKQLGLEFKLKNDLKSATAWIPVEGLKALSTTVLSVAGMLARPPPPHPPPPKCIHGYRHRLVTRRTHISHRLGRRLGHRWAIAAARGTA